MRSSEILLALFFVGAVMAGLTSILPGKATFAGTHTVYEKVNSSTHGDALFCTKCHPEAAGNISSSAAHSTTGCICHGYYPNYTNIGGYNFSINLKHNVTLNIYCTNCHTGYNLSTGTVIAGDVNGTIIESRNQSAHYIFLNESNKTDIYVRSGKYFEQF